MKFFISAVIFASLLISFPLTGFAAEKETTGPNAEQRAKEIGQALRCVVCQNQSIEESDASLAKDMRRLVRARVESGDSNAEVIAYMQNRYGDFVLLKPPVKPSTYILWFAPFAFIFAGGLWFLVQTRSNKITAHAAPLSPDEVLRLDRLKRSNDEEG